MKACIQLINVYKKFYLFLNIKMSETTKNYFEREKQSRFDLLDYLDADENLDWNDKLDKARVIIWDDVDKYIAYEKDDDWNEMIDLFNTDRDWLYEAVRDYCDPLSIERRVRVNPRDPHEIESYQDSKYKILITYGWPNVFREIDFTAELHLYWWGEHYSRDFW